MTRGLTAQQRLSAERLLRSDQDDASVRAVGRVVMLVIAGAVVVPAALN